MQTYTYCLFMRSFKHNGEIFTLYMYTTYIQYMCANLIISQKIISQFEGAVKHAVFLFLEKSLINIFVCIKFFMCLHRIQTIILR